MSGTGNPSYLYSVGVDTTQAAAQLRDFAAKTAPGLLADIKPIELRLDTTAASSSVRRFISYATDALKSIPPVNVTFNFSGASRSLNAFMANFARNASAIKDLEASMNGLSRAGSSLGASFSQFSGGVGSLKENLRGAAGGATLFAGESERAAGSAERLGAAAEKNSTAMDYLGKIAVADMAKILAWGAAFEVVQGAVHGFTDSLEQAGEVQMEQTLQRLYNSTINVNQAFTNAEMIAKQWGGNIVDVQQAIGLWTKQTNDLAAATMLASKGEEMARASGIATADVYKDSLAIGTQMGLTYSQLPAVYDQITHGALRLGETLRGVNDRASEGTEAMKDLFQGLARASATLSANSFSDANSKLKGTAAIIAIVANQITAMGDSGKTAATNLATMFGALSQGGPKRGEWESILGVDAFKNADSLLQAMQKHLGELQQAQADGKLGVRPQQVETLATMEKSLQHISELYHDIAQNSKGALDTVAMAEMATYQAQVDKLRTAIQALEISIGTQLLPQMEGWVNWLGSTAIPQMESMSPALVGASQDVLRLVAAWAALQGISKVSSFWQATTSQVDANTAALNANIVTETRARAAGFEDISALEKLQSTLAVYNENLAATTQANTLLSEAFAKLGAEAGLTEEQIARITPAALEAGLALNQLREQTAGETASFAQLDAAVEQGDGQLNLFTAAVSRAAAAEVELKSATEAAGGAALVSVTGWQRAAQGIGLIATNAIATLGPLAAMTAGLWAAQQAAKAGNSGDNAALAIQNWAHDRTDAAAANAGALGYDQNRTPADFIGGMGTSIQGTLGAWWYGTKQQQGSAAGNNLVSQMLHSQQFGGQTATDLAGMQRTQFSDRGQYDAYEKDLEGAGKSFTEMKGVTQQTSTEMKSLEDQLRKMAQASNGYAAALAHPMGASEGNRAFYQPSAKGGGGGNPDATALNQTTQAYSALVKSKQDAIAADDAEIKTAETLIGLYGQQPKYLNEISSAYANKITQLNGIVGTTKAYIASLTAQISKDQEQLASSKLTAKERAQINGDLLKTENALITAHGSLIKAEADVAQAQADRALEMEKLNEKQNEQKFGLVDLTTQLKAMSDALQLLKGHTSEQLSLAQQDVVSLQAKKTALEGLIAQYGAGSAAAEHWQADLNAINAALDTTHSVVTTDTADITKLTDSISKAIETLQKSNFDEAGGILGINKQTITYMDQMLSGMEQIEATQQQINRDRVGADPAQQQLLNMEQQELNLRKQLLPIEQQILQVRSSPLYTAWESEIDKMGQGFGDKLVQKMFGGGGATGAMAVIHQFLSGIGEDVFNSLWKTASSSITDKLFGLGGPDKQLQTALTTLTTQLQAQFQGFNTTVTGPLTTAAQLIAQGGKDFLQGATGSTGGVPGGAGTLLNNDPYSALNAYDQKYGISSDMDVGQSYESANTTASNTTSMSTSLTSIDNTLTSMQQDAVNQFAQITGLNVTGGTSGSGFAAAGGIAGVGGGIFSGLFGGGGGGAGGGGGILGALGGLTGGSPMGALALALTAGSAFGGIFGSNVGKAGTSGRETNGMLGGLIGGAGALGGLLLALGGPVGATLMGMGPIGWGIAGAGILGGALLGSLFGDHFSAQDEPDINEPVTGGVSYGQFVANMNGAQGSFGGQTMSPFSQYQGVDREAMQLETDIQKVLANPNAPAALKTLAKQLQALNPGNEPEGFSILSEKNDVFQLHSGASVNVQSFQGMVQQFMQMYAKMPQAALAPILSINGAGAGPGWGPNMYNTPGMTNSDLTGFEQSSWSAYGSNTPYNTPGVGNGGSGGGPPIQTNFRGSAGGGGSNGGGNGGTIQLVVDGKILAQIVNAYNAQYLLNSGRGIDQVPVIQ